jgi:hypothetical protein
MRIPAPQYPQALATSPATSHDYVSSLMAIPSHTTLADMGNTFPTHMPHNPTVPSTEPQHQPHSRSCPPFPVQPGTTHVDHRAATTMPWRSEPPPLQFSKSPYCRIPLPAMAHGPVSLDPILAYSSERSVASELNTSQGQPVDVLHRRHICSPATNPSLESLTVVLPNDQGVITIHASFDSHSFVTVGDVLGALNAAFLRGSSTEAPPLVEGIHCACKNGTALQALRSHYKRAGLMKTEEGFDIWDLRIG